MTSVVLRTAVRSVAGSCARARRQDAAGWRLGLALLIGLAPVVGGCAATPAQPSPVPSAAAYLIVAAPYQLLPPTPDLTAAAEALGKAEAGSLPQRAATAIAVRSVAAAIVRAPDGVQFAAFVVFFDDAVLSLPGGRDGAIRSMNQQNTATSHEVDGVTIYTADRNEYGLASWLDGDFLVIVRANLRDLPAQHEPALLAVSRALLDGRR